MAHDRDKWWAVVSKVINLLFSIKCKTHQLNEELLASQGLHSKEMDDSQNLQFQWTSCIYIANKCSQT